MLGPKSHEYSVSFSGNAADALNVARTALLALGFEIVRDTRTELHAEGPGMHSNQQPELVGASSVRFNVSSTRISVTAELGSLAKLIRFVSVFPPLLVGGLLVMGHLIDPAISLFHMLWLVPWAGIAVLISRSLKHKTTRAIDRLTRGMAQAGTR